MEPGPIKESEETFSEALLAQLLKDVHAALALQDKELIQWPADEKGQKRIPTALGAKLNRALLLPIVGRALQHHALLYVNILEMLLKKFRVETKAQHLKVDKTEVKIDATSVNPDAHAIKAFVNCHRRLADRSDTQRDADVQKLTAPQLDMCRYVARQMENNEVPYVVKMVRGRDPNSVDIAFRTEPIWRTKSYKQKAGAADPDALQDAPMEEVSQHVPDAQEYVMPDSFPEDMLYEPRPVADAAGSSTDGPPDPLDAAMPNFDPFAMPIEEELLDAGMHGSGHAAMPIADGPAIESMVADVPTAAGPSVEAVMDGIPPEHETMQERYNRLADTYGESAALALTGMVQEGWHYDPVAQQWSQLHGFVSPLMPARAPDAPVAETLQDSEVPAMCVPGERAFGLDDRLFETLSISSGLPSPKADQPMEAAEGSPVGNESVEEAKMFLLQKLHMQRERIMAGSMPDNVETCPMAPDVASDALEKQRLFNGSSREAFPSQIKINDTPDGHNETLGLHNPDRRQELLASGPSQDLLASGPQEDLFASGPQEDLLASGPQEDLLASGPQEDLASGPQEDLASGLQEDLSAEGPQEDLSANGPPEAQDDDMHQGLESCGPELPPAAPPCEPTEAMDPEDVLDVHSQEEVMAHDMQVELRKKRQLELKRRRENDAAVNGQAKKPKATAAKRIMKRPAAKQAAPEELPEDGLAAGVAEIAGPSAAGDGVAAAAAEMVEPPVAEAEMAPPAAEDAGVEPEPKAKGRGRGRGGRGGRKGRMIQEAPEANDEVSAAEPKAKAKRRGRGPEANDEVSAAEPKAKAKGRGRGPETDDEASPAEPEAKGKGRGRGRGGRKPQDAEPRGRGRGAAQRVADNDVPAEEEEKTPPRKGLSDEQKRICRELLGCCSMSLSRYS
ncbi:unnamed protein product [Symbiodinium sp. CCMP2592]|nr:unnamed protein product [Symbiodinium sp. CCMP2592]